MNSMVLMSPGDCPPAASQCLSALECSELLVEALEMSMAAELMMLQSMSFHLLWLVERVELVEVALPNTTNLDCMDPIDSIDPH